MIMTTEVHNEAGDILSRSEGNASWKSAEEFKAARRHRSIGELPNGLVFRDWVNGAVMRDGSREPGLWTTTIVTLTDGVAESSIAFF